MTLTVDAYGEPDIVFGHFDIFQCLAAMFCRFDFPLVLVQQRDTLDQGEIFHVVTAGTGLGDDKSN
ncbi:hypothetical protein XBJ1_0283 [Xenorhabdus bovienii SS-2004]|uniref:Uncharacterized protein n=1 Tax=Xenorhabdus bovienii (strain SS-2004) TaxID=406818 RepID=D3UYQ6_XENBS|nr:hypothetical protein XBJ1_0283 [Xenorhabdus bovienii SS-2004]